MSEAQLRIRANLTTDQRRDYAYLMSEAHYTSLEALTAILRPDLTAYASKLSRGTDRGEAT